MNADLFPLYNLLNVYRKEAREKGLSPVTLLHVQRSLEQVSRERKTNSKNKGGRVSILYKRLVMHSC